MKKKSISPYLFILFLHHCHSRVIVILHALQVDVLLSMNVLVLWLGWGECREGRMNGLGSMRVA